MNIRVRIPPAFLVIAVATVSLWFAVSVSAATYSWDQTAGGAQSWTTATNWNPDGVPNSISGDRIEFLFNHAGGSGTLLDLGADRTAEDWVYSNNGGFNSKVFTINSGNTITLAGATPSIEVGVGSNAPTFIFNNILAGTAGFTKKGKGTLELNNAGNSFSGGITLEEGTLKASNAALGNVANNINFTGSATLEFNGSYARSLTLNGGTVASFSANTITLTGAVTGAGGVNVSHNGFGTEAVTLSSTANNFTGPITIGDNGVSTLTVNSLADSTSPLTLKVGSNRDATFIWGSGAVSPLTLNDRPIVIAGSGTDHVIENANANASNTVTINQDWSVTSTSARTILLQGVNTGNNTIAGSIPDGASSSVTTLTKNGSGKWILSGVNTYTGNTTITDGTLEIGGAGHLGAGNYAGNISIGSGDSFIYNSTANQNLSGNITGAGSLAKNNSGTLTLGGTNGYTGSTTVTGGALLIDGSTSASSSVGVGVSGTLGGSGTVGGNTSIQGSHTPGSSAGIQTFSSNLTYTGGASSVEWELTDNTVTNAANPNALFDTVIVNGNLDFDGPTSLNLVFNNASSVDWTDSFWGTDHLGTSGWLLYDVAGTTFDFNNLSLNTINWLDSNGASFNTVLSGETSDAMFSLFQDGQDIYVNFTAAVSPVPIPEPGTFGLSVLAIGLMLLRKRRRT